MQGEKAGRIGMYLARYRARWPLLGPRDPKNAEKRRRGQSRGGRGKPTTEIRAIKAQLEDLAASVLAGTVDRGNAVVVNQILNTRARLIELERKVKETEELEERLEELERLAQSSKPQSTRTGRTWGA